ncbi:hypothetical protein, partial [Vreelandella maris]|uniref:hypothetical protein n=1 Tax=Vreelandella maris TaxID=2729617 RepID=UPI0030EC69C6
GYRLGMIEAIAMVNGKQCSAGKLPDHALRSMTPNFMEAAKTAGFYPFIQADDATGAALFKRIDELPKIRAAGTLVA